MERALREGERALAGRGAVEELEEAVIESHEASAWRVDPFSSLTSSQFGGSGAGSGMERALGGAAKEVRVSREERRSHPPSSLA